MVLFTETYELPAATWTMGQNINYQFTIPAPPATCYILAPNASITISVNIKGNGGDVAGTGMSTIHTAASVAILWQTESNLITLGTFNSTTQRVTITASGSTGNCVIAALDNSGHILWSWHIWVTNYDPDNSSVMNGNTYAYNNYTWMDRNLGATTTTAATVTTMGLHYQWGRKDPFPGSASVSSIIETTLVGTYTSVTKTAVSVSSNLANTILNPVTFYYCSDLTNHGDWYSVTASTHNDALWGGASTTTPSDKTIFDPCPAGWRVPAWSGGLSPWNGFNETTFPFYNASDWDLSYGRVYTSASNTYYPAASYRDNQGMLFDIGSEGPGVYWSASPSQNNMAYDLTFYNGGVMLYDDYRIFGFSVRCVRE
jgi:hypothetical protein